MTLEIGTVEKLKNYKELITKRFSEEIYKISEARLEILDDNYGADRNINEDDGGYIVYLINKYDYLEFMNKAGMVITNNLYEDFSTFGDFVIVDYMVNNETMISVCMPKEYFKE